MSPLKKIGLIASREFRSMWIDSRLRSVIFIAPVVYAALFCWVYSKHTLTQLPIAVLMEDSSAQARLLVRMLGSSQKLAIAKTSRSTANLQEWIYDRSIGAAVVIPKDFTLRLKRGHDAHVVAYLNAASMVSANIAAKAINEVVLTFSAGVELKTLMKKGEKLASAKEHFQPVKLDLHTLFNPLFNYTNFMVPGLLMAILQQVILMGIALSWTGEKEAKTISELLKISNRPWVLIAGKALPYCLINWFVAEFYLRVLFPINDIPMEGSWFIVIPFTFLFVVTIVTWGLWASALCRTRLFATQALMFLALPSFVLSGFTWPAEGMPFLVRGLAQLLPMTHFVNSFRNIYLGAAPWAYVYQDFLVLIGFTIVNLILSYLVIRRIVTQWHASS